MSESHSATEVVFKNIFVSVCKCKHQDLITRNVRWWLSQINKFRKFSPLNWIPGLSFSIFYTVDQPLPIRSKILLARHKFIVCLQFARNRDNWIFRT